MLDAHEEGAAEVQLKETLASKDSTRCRVGGRRCHENQYSNVGVSCSNLKKVLVQAFLGIVLGNCEERKASAAVAAESQAELARKVAESANEVAALRQELATAEAGHCNMQDAARYRAVLVHESQSHPDLLEGSKQISASCLSFVAGKHILQRFQQSSRLSTLEDALSSCQTSKREVEAPRALGKLHGLHDSWL